MKETQFAFTSSNQAEQIHLHTSLYKRIYSNQTYSYIDISQKFEIDSSFSNSSIGIFLLEYKNADREQKRQVRHKRIVLSFVKNDIAALTISVCPRQITVSYIRLTFLFG